LGFFWIVEENIFTFLLILELLEKFFLFGQGRDLGLGILLPLLLVVCNLLLVVRGVNRGGDLRTSSHERSLRHGLFLILRSCEINLLQRDRVPVLGKWYLLSLDLNGRLHDFDGEVDNLAITKLIPSRMLHEQLQRVMHLDVSANDTRRETFQQRLDVRGKGRIIVIGWILVGQMDLYTQLLCLVFPGDSIIEAFGQNVGLPCSPVSFCSSTVRPE